MADQRIDAAERAGVLEDRHYFRHADSAKRPFTSVPGAAKWSATGGVLPFVPRVDWRAVPLAARLFAALLGGDRSHAGNCREWPASGQELAVDCELAGDELFQMAVGKAFGTGGSGENDLHSLAVLGHSRDNDTVLGAVSDAAGSARHNPARGADSGSNDCGDPFPAFGRARFSERRAGLTSRIAERICSGSAGF